eukprot:72846-Prorocentrum_minimum.AAC.1
MMSHWSACGYASVYDWEEFNQTHGERLVDKYVPIRTLSLDFRALYLRRVLYLFLSAMASRANNGWGSPACCWGSPACCW